MARFAGTALALGLLSATAAADPLTQEHDGPVRVAVAGATRAPGEPWEADALVRDIERYNPNLVILTGGSVLKGSAREWADFRDRWTTLGDRLIALPDRRTYRRDRQLTRWKAAGVEPGGSGLGKVTWGTGLLESRGVRWRLLVLNAERAAMGTAWLDQRTWLPRALQSPSEPLIVVSGRPLASLQHAPSAGSFATRELLADIDANASPGQLRVVITGGTHTNELLLHAGPFGEAHVVAGTATVEAADLDRFGTSSFPGVGEMALVDDFDAALQRVWQERGLGAIPEDRYPSDALPTQGWWQVELDGPELSLAFRIRDADGAYAEVYRIRYRRETGWVLDPPAAASATPEPASP